MWNIQNHLTFHTYFHYFISFWGSIFWYRIVEKYFIIWYPLEYTIMYMFNYLLKTSVINLKEFIVESINYLSWESNLSSKPPSLFKYCLEVSMNTNQWGRLRWKTAYSMILANNTKWDSSQLFGWRKAKLGPLGRWHLHHLMFITELLLLWPVGHMDPNITDWATKPTQVPTWMWRFNLQNHS